MIELRDLAVRYDGAEAVRDVSLEVGAEEWVMLIGPNGAGKTSVLRALCGLLPFGGEASVDGRDVRSFGKRELARRVAFVPQNPVMPPDLTVSEYVLLGRTPHLGSLAAEGRRDRWLAADYRSRVVLFERVEPGPERLVTDLQLRLHEDRGTVDRCETGAADLDHQPAACVADRSNRPRLVGVPESLAVG